jgi:hypothetical protein
MKEITIQIEGQDFIIDLDKAKSLGVVKEDPTIKDFNVGDVFLLASGSKVIIVQTGYTNIYESDIEQRYSFAGLDGLRFFSNFGKEGATKEKIISYLNQKTYFEKNTKFLKNINKDISKLISDLV